MTLDGLWSFSFLKRGVDPTKIDPKTLNYNTTLLVPGVWDATLDYSGK